MIKINTDGSFMEQNGKVGISGVARDEDGNMIFAFLCQYNVIITMWLKLWQLDMLDNGEANMVADYLAKLATMLDTPLLAQDLNQLPNKALGLYFLNKRQLPSARL
ncbi:hypothetical protein HAX54_013052 [Datura stramonium]|uniref:RNase H type-1 domain-containing protein n=1 Tax=Datura stramonium TaxID=4076 RepID=A0ABS8TNF2_DATST|nr:hypothetical protein [Datura stramonium]